MLYEVLSIVLVAASLILAVLTSALLVKAYKLYKTLASLLEPQVKAKKLRKRYIVFAAICEHRVSYKDVEKAIEKTFLELYGKAYLQKASPKVVLFDENLQRGIIRVSHLYKDHLISVLGLVKNIGDSKCIVAPLKTTGTIKKAREYLGKLKV